MDCWLVHVRWAAGQNYDLAIEVARCYGLVKGYGNTHARGTRKSETIMATLPATRARPDAAIVIAGLRKAAQQEEGDGALTRALQAAVS